MKNIKYLLLTVAACLIHGNLLAQSTFTCGFESQADLTNNFTYSCEMTNGSMTIATDVKKTGTSSLKATMGGTGGKNNYLLTKTAYTNISEISFYLASSDKGKTSFAIEYSSTANFSSDVHDILPMTVFTSLNGLPASPSNKTMYLITLSGLNVSGYLRFTFRQPSSSGKFLWMDDLTITYGGGGTTPPTPSTVAVTGVTLNKTTTSLTIGQTETLTATVAPANATDQTVTWSSSNTAVATVANGVVTAVAAGTANITVTTTDGSKTATCAVTVTTGTTPPPATVAVTGVTLNKTTTSLTVGQTETLTATVAPANATDQTVTWSSSNTAVATVANGVVTAVAAGTANITVTTTDGNKTATCAVTVTAPSTEPVTPPTTTLTLHEPDLYDAPRAEGGYNTPLVRYDNRDWEVYYTGRPRPTGSRIAGVVTGYNAAGSDEDAKYAGFYVSNTDASTTECHAADGWFTAKIDALASASLGAAAPFAGAAGEWRLKNNTHYIELHIKGYDQFAIYALDKKSNGDDYSKPADIKHFEVFVDGVKQACNQISTTATVRSYTISTGEHVIRITCTGDDTNKFYGFALRPAFVPRVKYVEGNDSTQVVRQTESIRPVTYFLKNKVSAAELTWTGAQANGISLQPLANDTFQLAGTANCPNGVYSYTISAKDANNTVVSTITGQFSVKSEIKALSDTMVTTFIKSPIPAISFRYYAYLESDVQFAWTNGTPAGLTFSTNATNHTASITGSPTATGTFPFTISVVGGNTIHGEIEVLDNKPTVVPGASKTMLYLYKNNRNAGLFAELITKYNYFARPAGDAMLSDSEYSAYDFIVISEDVDATNAEVQSIIRSLAKPVLNQKAFTYSPSRLGWGIPDNGSISNKNIVIRNTTHPIFAGVGIISNQILDGVYNSRGLMPVEITSAQGYALAVAPKRGFEYDDDGDFATFIHEIPAAQRGAKYLSFPIGLESSAHLNANGKKLLHNMITYLCDNSTFTSTPDLRIEEFSINGVLGLIDENKQEITLTLPVGTNLTSLTPYIRLADPTCFVTPNARETQDFSDRHYGVVYTVSNYIQKHSYTVYVRVPSALEDVTEDGLWYADNMLHNNYSTWVNIYTANGTLLTTTNSDYDFSPLPRGMYLVVTASGSMKIMH